LRKSIVYGLLATLLFAGLYFGLLRSHISDKNYSIETIKKPLTLVDDLTKTKFILDTAQNEITATDITGRTLWTIDPRKDGNLDTYRIDHTKIIYFKLEFDEHTAHKEVIKIAYNNSQFGIIDKETGKFTFHGQD
jgi:hypothetical protein